MLISNAFTKSMTSTTEVFVTVHQPVHVIYLSTISTLLYHNAYSPIITMKPK